MANVVEELRREAEAAIAALSETARRARDAHARAELMRHMLWTARKVKDRLRVGAVAFVMAEWLGAWRLDRTTCKQVDEMEALAAAFQDLARQDGAAEDDAVRRALAALDRAYAAPGTCLADEMAWRSGCAHGWWAEVRPTPAALGYPARGGPTEPFWRKGCPAHCLEA